MGTGGSVVWIFVAALAHGAMRPLDEVRVVDGRGLEGDRYFGVGRAYADGRPGIGRHVTLIEEEALDAARRDYEVDLPPGGSRRNLVTRGVALNHLVDREFAIGAEVVLRGVRLCEPCRHLDKLSGGLACSRALVHRGGLRAEIVRGGVIRVGDSLRDSPRP